MKILSLHGWQSTPGGLKPTFLKDHGYEILNPKLPDDDFDAASDAEGVRKASTMTELVDVTVYYLEMLSRPQRSVPAPRDGLLILHAKVPSVPYYRFLYLPTGAKGYTDFPAYASQATGQ